MNFWYFPSAIILLIFLISAQGMALELPVSGDMLVLTESMNLTIESGEVATMNGTLVVNGTPGGELVLRVINRGNLTIDGGYFLCQNGNISIQNHGLIEGFGANLSSRIGGNVSLINQGEIENLILNLSSFDGGFTGFVNRGRFFSNISTIAKTDFELAINNRGGAIFMENWGEFRPLSTNIDTASDGNSEFVNRGNATLGNLNLHTATSGNLRILNSAQAYVNNIQAYTTRLGRLVIVNHGNLTVNNGNLQTYDAHALVENHLDLFVNNLFVKSQTDDGSQEPGTLLRDYGEAFINNISIVSNGAKGNSTLHCVGNTRVNNCNIDANYGGLIAISLGEGWNLSLGNANFDASGSSHGKQSTIRMLEHGDIYLGNLNVKNNRGWIDFIHNGTGYIGNQKIITSGSGALTSVVYGGNYSSNNLHAQTMGGNLHCHMANGDFNNFGFEDVNDYTRIWTDGPEINNLMVVARGGDGQIDMSFSGFTHLNSFSIRALMGASVNYTAENTSIDEMSVEASGTDKGSEASIGMFNDQGVVIEEVDVVGFENSEFRNLTMPNGTQNLTFLFPEGGINLVSTNSSIQIEQSLAVPLLVLLLLLGYGVLRERHSRSGPLQVIHVGRDGAQYPQQY